MYQLITYLKHLITATNQHGIHSPFVYDYLTKCLYTSSDYEASKSLSVLLKSISYFSIERTKIISKDDKIENRIQKDFDLDINKSGPFDLIYMDGPKADVISINRKKIHNDSFCLIENIHQNKDSFIIWEELKKDEMVTVSIDLYYCGLLFFRKEQVKEHFKIRI